MKELVKNFLKNDLPEQYDFKLLEKEYYQCYNKDGRYTELIKNIGEQINTPIEDHGGRTRIEQWFAYKLLEENDEYLREHRSVRRFDCDNSNDTCELTKGIYYYLWGWKKEGNYGHSLFWEDSGTSDHLGGDTMNSLGTTMIEYLKTRGVHVKSVKECKERYDKDDLVKKYLKEWKGLNDFARNVSCIGNFVLVPGGFNKHRGVHPGLRDYWDLSLDDLAYNKDAWLPGRVRVKHARDNKAFIQYVNTFFLWDYVDDNYEIKPLFASHEDKLGADKELNNEKVFPDMQHNGKEFDKFLGNVNSYINRRGKFMAAMLNIALNIDRDTPYTGERQEEWKDWKVSGTYKKIVEEVLLSDKCFLGYHEVIEEIQKQMKESKFKDDINKIFNEILDSGKEGREELNENLCDE